MIASTYDASEKELLRLGGKNEEEEIEKFITSNTQELLNNNWLCNLSGKIFKSPKCVCDHIINNYSHLLDDVKTNVNLNLAVHVL